MKIDVYTFVRKEPKPLHMRLIVEDSVGWSNEYREEFLRGGLQLAELTTKDGAEVARFVRADDIVQVLVEPVPEEPEEETEAEAEAEVKVGGSQ
jgi:hypothetical protein